MRDWPKKPIRKFKRAVFLDRDGTINIDTDFTHNVEDLKFTKGAIEGIKILSKLPLEIIVVSNQAGIAKGIFTQKQMSEFNKSLLIKITSNNGRIDAFYYCPHLEKKDLSLEEDTCFCSKPNPGMLIEAAKDFDLDLSKSFIIGDRLTDIEAGQKVGSTPILIKGTDNENLLLDTLKKIKLVDDLLEASLFIKSHSK